MGHSKATRVRVRTCITVSPQLIDQYMLRYLGQGPNLTPDETQILLMALYLESCEHGGVAAKALAIMDGRLAEQTERLGL